MTTTRSAGIRSVKPITSNSKTALIVFWLDNLHAEFSCLWLRDNARDPLSFDTRSHQRELFTAEIPTNIQPDSVVLTNDGAELIIRWPDLNEPVRYESSFLRRYSGCDSEPSLLSRREPWNKINEARKLSLRDLRQESPIPGASLGHSLMKDGFAVVTDCPETDEGVTQLAEFLGYVRETIYGGVWRFEADEAMADSAYTSKALRPHTDGTYSLDAPGVQILLCLENEATGGQSILVDGLSVAEQIKRDYPEVFSNLTQINIEGCYKGDGTSLRASRPVFSMSAGELQQVSFNNYDRAPMHLPPDAMDRMYQGIQTVDRYFNDPDNQWRYTLKAGEALVFDNWRLLHGRTAFSGVRRMAGAYVNREDLLSFQARVMSSA